MDPSNTVNHACVASRKGDDNKKMRFFPATEPLELIAIDILCPLLETKSGNLYNIIMTDHFSKLMKGIPTTKTTAKMRAIIILEHWVSNFGKPRKF